MDNNLFNELVEIIAKKENKIVFNEKNLLKEILGDVDVKDTKLSDISLYNSSIEKDKYTFNIITIPRKTPIRKPNATSKLDFEMKQFYVTDITINDDSSYCSLTVDKTENRKEAKQIYLSWKDYISSNELKTIFEKLIDKVKS